MSIKDLAYDIQLAQHGDVNDTRPDKFELRRSEFAFPCCICDHATRQPEKWCKTNCRHYML